ncbi:MAG: hypothetical protein AVDCRST_MAG69-2343, partial [uncultured Solirubrobacteraceae bacterium]
GGFQRRRRAQRARGRSRRSPWRRPARRHLSRRRGRRRRVGRSPLQPPRRRRRRALRAHPVRGRAVRRPARRRPLDHRPPRAGHPRRRRPRLPVSQHARPPHRPDRARRTARLRLGADRRIRHGAGLRHRDRRRRAHAAKPAERVRDGADGRAAARLGLPGRAAAADDVGAGHRRARRGRGLTAPVLPRRRDRGPRRARPDREPDPQRPAAPRLRAGGVEGAAAPDAPLRARRRGGVGLLPGGHPARRAALERDPDRVLRRVLPDRRRAARRAAAGGLGGVPDLRPGRARRPRAPAPRARAHAAGLR